MIVVTFKGSPSPLPGKAVRGLNVVSDVPGPSVSRALAHAVRRFRNETEGFLFVSPGSRIHAARILPMLKKMGMENGTFDWAAHINRIGSVPTEPRPFDGVGRLLLDTLIFRPTPVGVRVFDRWIERNATAPEREQVNLAIALAELRDADFFYLPRTWVWRENEMRVFDNMAEPIVELSGSENGSDLSPKKVGEKGFEDPKKTVDPAHRPRGPEVLWNGHLYSYASYGKINREVLLRVANSVSVRIDSASSEQVLIDEYTRSRLDPYKGTLIGQKAPFLRFFGPDFQPQAGRHRINWTLMETHGRVHADMVQKVNESYDELWVCTEWNAETFKAGGVKVPISVVPLGVDRAIYHPQRRRKMPSCRLISTSKRGTFASPEGFIFLSVGLPSARKGFEVAADAFALAFGPKDGVDLVFATTHGATSWTSKLATHVAQSKVRIWVLEGRFNEHEMAGIYAASDAYVSASIGEGWNLPAHEASACGKPVIVPRNSVHPEIFGDDAFIFDTDGFGRLPEVEQVSPWYVGMEFSLLKTEARKNLAEAMRVVHVGGVTVRQKVRLLDDRMSPFTWDATAANVTRRLIEAQP